MSTTTTATSTDPTAPSYNCGSGCGSLTFTWDAKVFPGGGRVGTVTLGQFVNKPIQAYDAKPLYDSYGRQIGTNWGYQAQDGSFVGRMYVAFYKSIIRFAHFRANDKWPQITCFVSPTDPRDSREAIENAQ